jgi:4-amino-4-deoxy-L-arabinose transferase-like glycosyltransferase
MKTVPILVICLAVSLILGASWFWSVPLAGDDGSYSYRSARWIAENGMPFIPSGVEKGEQANGHPTLFFWLWAVFMRLFGNSLMTARILPTLATWLTLAGTWKFACTLSRDRLSGIMAAAGLLACPMFLAQGFRPLPDMCFAAAAVWSLFCFSRGRVTQAVLLCILAVLFREQGVLLACSFLLADLVKERRFRSRMLLWGLPLAVLAGHYLLNFLVNGHCVDPRHIADAADSHPAEGILYWLGYFSGHLLGEDYRWFPICTGLALALSGPDRRLTLAAAAALIAPVFFHGGHPLPYLLLLAALGAWVLWSRKRMPTLPVLAVLVFCSSLVVFFTLLTLVSPDPPHDLFRYLLGAYPGMMALLAAWLTGAGRRTAILVWSLFMVGSLASFGAVRSDWQVEDSPLGQVIAVRMREAIMASENPYLERMDFLLDPALGFVDEARPFCDSVRGQVISSGSIRGIVLPPNYRFASDDTVYHWSYGRLHVFALGIAPRETHSPEPHTPPQEPRSDR